MEKDSNNQKPTQMQRRMFEMCSNMSMEDCQSFMQKMAKNKPNFENLKVVEENENIATPELQILFFEWCNQIEDEFREFIKNNNTDNAEAIAKHFKLSHESCIYLLNRIKNKN